MTQTYIEWMYPGTIVSESSTEKVKDRTIPDKYPKNAYAFRFFDKEEIESGGEKLTGNKKNVSGFYYMEAEELTVAEVKLYHAEKRTLISNMENNGYETVIHTRHGQFIPKFKEDILLTALNSK